MHVQVQYIFFFPSGLVDLQALFLFLLWQILKVKLFICYENSYYYLLIFFFPLPVLLIGCSLCQHFYFVCALQFVEGVDVYSENKLESIKVANIQ